MHATSRSHIVFEPVEHDVHQYITTIGFPIFSNVRHLVHWSSIAGCRIFSSFGTLIGQINKSVKLLKTSRKLRSKSSLGWLDNGAQTLESQLRFLYHLVTPGGIQLDASKWKLLWASRFRKQLRIWVSCQGAQHQLIINAYLPGPKSKDSWLIVWSPEASQAFESTKQQLVQAALLEFPQEDAPLAVFFDPSDIVKGVALH